MSKLAYVEEHEVDGVVKLIEENLGFKLPKVRGNNMLVKLYVRPEDVYEPKDKNGNPIIGENGQVVKIELPRGVRQAEYDRTCVALVLAQGHMCYKSDIYKECGPYCRVGDWISIPRNDKGTVIIYRGVPMLIIQEKRIYQVLQSPEEIKRPRTMLV